MKTINEIIKQKPVFLNDWACKNWKGIKAEAAVFGDFEIEPVDGKILFASYGSENYSGEAWVLFEKNGELFEVNGSHCSCYGLEGQWEPEPVTLSVLEHRLTNGTWGIDDWSENTFRKDLCKFLGVEITQGMEG